MNWEETKSTEKIDLPCRSNWGKGNTCSHDFSCFLGKDKEKIFVKVCPFELRFKQNESF